MSSLEVEYYRDLLEDFTKVESLANVKKLELL
jgi:hypothetical protein